MGLAFNIALVAWILSEWSIRLRSRVNREGSRVDRNSMLVVVASVFAALVGAIEIARRANGASLAVLAVLPTAGLVYRIHFEERALLEGLGEPYRRFAASRPRLFPGVW